MIWVVIFLCVVILVLWSAVCCAILEHWNVYDFSDFLKLVDIILHPARIYEKTEMNKAGCLICTVLLAFLLLPLMMVYLVYVLFHIGRKDEKKWQRILIIEDISFVKIEETSIRKYGKDLNMLNESSVFLKDASRVRNRR